MKNILRTLILITCFGLGANLLIAQWAICPKMNNPISTATNDQFFPSITSDGAGGAIITWHDNRGGIDYDIYAQRVNASGVVMWTANGIAITTATNDQLFPTIITDGFGGATISWQDHRSATNYDVYAQRINASGVVQWTANGVAVSTATNDQSHPTIISDATGDAIIAWQDHRSGTRYDFYAQRVNAVGAVQWAANGVAITTAGSDSEYDIPKMTSDGASGAIITWNKSIYASYYQSIFAQLIDSSGVLQWIPNGVEIATGWDPAIISDGAGGAIITWAGGYNVGPDVYAQRVNGAGVLQWDTGGVPISTAADDQYLTRLVSDGNGGAIIAWKHTPGSYFYTQRINADGVVQWKPNGVMISSVANDEYSPIIVSDGIGGAIMTFVKNVDGDLDIYAQRVDGFGSMQWGADGVNISTEPNHQQQLPIITVDNAGGAIITWGDTRSGFGWDIYAQRVNSNGHLYNPLEPGQFVMSDKWNMVSVPYTVSDYSKMSLFPSASTPTFAYEGTYTPKDTLVNGIGYWLRFNCEEVVSISGTPRTEDTVIVSEGWNMVGSISSPIAVTSVGSIPGGITTSEFFGYNGKYSTTTTIEPGNAYWVKVNQGGKLILSSSASTQSSSNRIRILPSSELPPPSPDGEMIIEPARGGHASGIPKQFALEQNYPNPFNPMTLIGYQIPVVSMVKLTLYNVLGQKVTTLVEEVQDAGYKTVQLDASKFSSGVYFYRVTAGKFTDIKKMLLLK